MESHHPAIPFNLCQTSLHRKLVAKSKRFPGAQFCQSSVKDAVHLVFRCLVMTDILEVPGDDIVGSEDCSLGSIRLLGW